MNENIDYAKKKFYQMISDFGSDPYNLVSHLNEMEKWAKYLLKINPSADKETVLIAVWLHDIGHYPINTNKDHAIIGEELSLKILNQIGYKKNKIENIIHCVRAHRCKDIMPKSIEAKIIACADSASHMTDSTYFDMSKDDLKANNPFRAYKKIERDFKDLDLFPQIKKELEDMYFAWKNLISSYEKLNLKS